MQTETVKIVIFRNGSKGTYTAAQRGRVSEVYKITRQKHVAESNFKCSGL